MDDEEFLQFYENLSENEIKEMIYQIFTLSKSFQFKNLNKDELIQQIKQEKERELELLQNELQTTKNTMDLIIQKHLQFYQTPTNFQRDLTKIHASNAMGILGEQNLHQLLQSQGILYDDTSRIKGYGDVIVHHHAHTTAQYDQYIDIVLECKNVSQTTLNSKLNEYISAFKKVLETAKEEKRIHCGILVFMKENSVLSPLTNRYLLHMTEQGKYVAILLLDEIGNTMIGPSLLKLGLDLTSAMSQHIHRLEGGGHHDTEYFNLTKKVQFINRFLSRQINNYIQMKKAHTILGIQIDELNTDLLQLQSSIST